MYMADSEELLFPLVFEDTISIRISGLQRLVKNFAIVNRYACANVTTV